MGNYKVNSTVVMIFLMWLMGFFIVFSCIVVGYHVLFNQIVESRYLITYILCKSCVACLLFLLSLLKSYDLLLYHFLAIPFNILD